MLSSTAAARSEHAAQSMPGFFRRFVHVSSSALAPPGGDGSVERKVYVKAEGQPGFVKLNTSTIDVADLTKEIINELKSLSGVDLGAVTLHIAKDKEGKAVGAALDAADLLANVLSETVAVEGNIRIVVKVANAEGSVAAAAKAGIERAVEKGRVLLRALLEAEPEDIADCKSGAKLIRLSGTAQWLQLGAAPLFLRPFYDKCVRGAMAGLAPGRRFIVRGNSGIGKSAFGMYMLWYAVKAKRTTVYVSDKVDYGYIFHADGRVDAFLREDLHSAALVHLDDPKALLIFDGDGDSRVQGQGRPPTVNATIAFVTSSKHSRFKEFKKLGVRDFGFPVFSAAEIADMLETCFPQFHNPDGRRGVKARYDKWGGIPRYVFHLVSASDQKEFDQALQNIDLSLLADLLRRNDIDATTDNAAISHRLFHLKVVGETPEGFKDGDTEGAYEVDRIELGSAVIKKAVFAEVQKHRSNELVKLLSQPTKGSQFAKLYSDLYEQHAITKLQAGGTFQRCALTAEKEEAGRIDDLQLPASESVAFFDTCDELEQAGVGASAPAAQRIWKPRGGTFAAIDLVLPGQKLANCTINERHPIQLFAKQTEGLVRVEEALGLSGGRIPFYWVMPSERYDSVRKAGCKPFPIVVRGPASSAGTGDAADASSAGTVDNASAGSAGAVDDASARITGAVDRAGALAASVSGSSAVRRKPGRPRKTLSSDDDALLRDYSERIDQYLLLVTYDDLKPGDPRPPSPATTSD